MLTVSEFKIEENVYFDLRLKLQIVKMHLNGLINWKKKYDGTTAYVRFVQTVLPIRMTD